MSQASECEQQGWRPKGLACGLVLVLFGHSHSMTEARLDAGEVGTDHVAGGGTTLNLAVATDPSSLASCPAGRRQSRPGL